MDRSGGVHAVHARLYSIGYHSDGLRLTGGAVVFSSVAFHSVLRQPSRHFFGYGSPLLILSLNDQKPSCPSVSPPHHSWISLVVFPLPVGTAVPTTFTFSFALTVAPVLRFKDSSL